MHNKNRYCCALTFTTALLMASSASLVQASEGGVSS